MKTPVITYKRFSEKLFSIIHGTYICGKLEYREISSIAIDEHRGAYGQCTLSTDAQNVTEK